ncbi:MAG: STAS domain-containing protein [Myxococcales bacterium]|nr:STAS domain-containing protein [Myxococcales bacterium]
MSSDSSIPPDESTDIQQRLSVLSAAAMEIAMGNFDVEIPIPDQEDELTEITAALELMRQDLSSMVDSLRAEVDRERTIAAQAATIRELSTPVIQIWDQILILPLIGTIDTARAKQIVDSLLSAIVEHQAAVAIIDVTGVPVFDTQVANHLLKTVEAARLLGAEVLLSGLRPHSAQTMTRLGVDLTAVRTKNSLRSGLEFALSETGKGIYRRPKKG